MKKLISESQMAKELLSEREYVEPKYEKVFVHGGYNYMTSQMDNDYYINKRVEDGFWWYTKEDLEEFKGMNLKDATAYLERLKKEEESRGFQKPIKFEDFEKALEEIKTAAEARKRREEEAKKAEEAMKSDPSYIHSQIVDIKTKIENWKKLLENPRMKAAATAKIKQLDEELLNLEKAAEEAVKKLEADNAEKAKQAAAKKAAAEAKAAVEQALKGLQAELEQHQDPEIRAPIEKEIEKINNELSLMKESKMVQELFVKKIISESSFDLARWKKMTGIIKG